MQKFYRRYGADGYLLRCDVHGYYDHLRHDYIKKLFAARVTPEVYRAASRVLDLQYAGDTGFCPGSQMVQIAGISGLSPLDHFVKERLRVRWYLRYMDDFILIHPDRAFLERCRGEIARHLEGIGLELHPRKTFVTTLKRGTLFLGFQYRLTPNGRVVMIIDPDNIKRNRKHWQHMVAACKRGLLPRAKVYESFNDWMEHAGKGNSFKAIQRCKEYFKSLWEV